MSAPPDPAAARIEAAAAAWLVKRDRGLTREEQDQFSQWLATDHRHGEWLARHQETWRQFNLLAEWRPEHGAEPNPDLLARPRRTTRWVAPVYLAMAAGVALAIAGGVMWRSLERGTAPVARAEHYERRVLTDGSVLELHRGAAVDLRFTMAERRVELVSGEAYFTVAKNPERPFVVHARGVGVRAVGTAFNVRLERDAVEVLVTEGRVQVSQLGGDASGADLVAGQRAIVRGDNGAGPEVAAFGYPFQIAGRTWTADLTIKNLTDKFYYASASSFGPQRHGFFTVSTKF